MSDFVNFNELVDSIVIEKDYGANRPVVEKNCYIMTFFMLFPPQGF